MIMCRLAHVNEGTSVAVAVREETHKFHRGIRQIIEYLGFIVGFVSKSVRRASVMLDVVAWLNCCSLDQKYRTCVPR